MPLADAGGVWQFVRSIGIAVLVKQRPEITMPREGINCPEFAPAAAPFSHLVKSGGLFYLSGQVAQDPGTGQFIEGDVASQMTRILANIQAVLQAVDRDLSHVVKTTVFLLIGR